MLVCTIYSIDEQQLTECQMNVAWNIEWGGCHECRIVRMMNLRDRIPIDDLMDQHKRLQLENPVLNLDSSLASPCLHIHAFANPKTYKSQNLAYRLVLSDLFEIQKPTLQTCPVIQIRTLHLPNYIAKEYDFHVH